MKPDSIVVISPSIDHVLGLGERRECFLIEALVLQPAVEALDVCFLHRLFWRDEV